MLTKSELMHIDTADNITMTCKATFAACPISSLGLVLMPTYRTLATCASFGASEAHDVGLFGFLCEVVDILAILPQGHPLVMVTTRIALTDAVGIADEERTNFLFLAKVDHFTSSFVTQITNATFCSCLDLILGSLQLSPSARVLLASGLLLCNLTQLLASLPFERPDATTCYDQGVSSIRRDGCQVDFTQINSCMNLTGCLFSLWHLNAHMQLKAVVPNKTASTTVFRQVKRQNKRDTSFAHRQDNATILTAHSLSRPLDRIEAFFSPRIFHLHLGMSLTELARGIDIGKKGVYNHLHRLAMQSKLAFRCLLQLIAPRPFGVAHSGLLVDLYTEVPNLSCFHLSISQASKQFSGGFQSIHTHCIHAMILPWKQMGCKWVKPDGVITRSDIIWFGYPNTEEKSLREQLSRKRKSSYRNVVSNMTLLFWHWKRIWIMFMSSLVLLPGFRLRLLRGCSKGIPHAIYERSSRISRNFVGKSICGQVRIMSERQEMYQHKLSGAISLNAKVSSRKANRARFHPNPLQGDGTSRVPFVKGLTLQIGRDYCGIRSLWDFSSCAVLQNLGLESPIHVGDAPSLPFLGRCHTEGPIAL